MVGPLDQTPVGLMGLPQPEAPLHNNDIISTTSNFHLQESKQ